VIHRDSGEPVLAEDQERHVRDGEDGSGVAFPVERGKPVGYWPTPTTMATPCPFDGPRPVREDWIELPAVVVLTMTTLPAGTTSSSAALPTRPSCFLLAAETTGPGRD
jgi:hypothetical protein